jgi:predicted HNH restriction endonuclease
MTTMDDLDLVCSNCHRMLYRELKTNGIKVMKVAAKKR